MRPDKSKIVLFLIINGKKKKKKKKKETRIDYCTISSQPHPTFERAQTRMRESLVGCVVVWLIQLSQSNYFTIVRVRPPSRRSVNHGTAVTNVPVTFIRSFLPRRIDDPRMHLIEDRPPFAKRNRTTRRRFLVSTRSKFTAKKGFKVHRCRQVRPTLFKTS